VSGFEIFREVAAYNAAAAKEERREAEEAARSNPEGTSQREGVPLWLWRGAGRG
jgi:hypothetical protein